MGLPVKKFLSHECGVTLIEVMVVVAIIAIFAGIALPSYQSIIERNKLKDALQEFKGALQLARSEALKSGQDVTFTVDLASEAAGAWCYGFGDLACAAATSGAKHPAVALTAGSNVTFDSRRGTASSASTYTLETTNLNFSTTVSVSVVGLITATDP